MGDRALLDQLQEMLGCEYLSDMKNGEWTEQLLVALGKIDAAVYSPQQWSQAVRYLFDSEQPFASTAEVKAYLAEKCSNL